MGCEDIQSIDPKYYEKARAKDALARKKAEAVATAIKKAEAMAESFGVPLTEYDRRAAEVRAVDAIEAARKAAEALAK